MVKKKHPGGRPSKMTDEMPNKLLDFFSREKTKILFETYKYKDGTTKKKEIEVAGELPFFSEFERENDLGVGRCSKWAAEKTDNGDYKHPEFRKAYKMAKGLQTEYLANNALKGLYAGPFSIFTAKNILGWRDKIETDNIHRGDKENPVKIEVEFIDASKD